MRKIKSPLALFYAVFLIAMISGCGQKPIDERMIGKWHTDRKGEVGAVFEFKGDGTYTVSYGGNSPGEEERIDPGNWWIVRHTESGVIVRFAKESRRPTDRLIEFFEDRLDFREKDGGFLGSYIPYESIKEKDEVSVAVKDDTSESDDSKDKADSDASLNKNPLEGVNFDGADDS